MDLWVAGSPLFEIRLGTGSTSLSARRGESCPAATVVGLMARSEDWRPRRRRHHQSRGGTTTRRAAKMMERRYRSGYRGLHQLEGQGRAGSRPPSPVSKIVAKAPEGDHEDTHPIARLKTTPALRSKETRPLKREIKAAKRRSRVRKRQARYPVRQKRGYKGYRVRDL